MEIDTERQKQARTYARIRHRLILVDLAIAAAGILIVLFSGLGTCPRLVPLASAGLLSDLDPGLPGHQRTTQLLQWLRPAPSFWPIHTIPQRLVARPLQRARARPRPGSPGY